MKYLLLCDLSRALVLFVFVTEVRSLMETHNLIRRNQLHFVVVRVFAFLKSLAFYYESSLWSRFLTTTTIWTNTLSSRLYFSVLYFLLCLLTILLSKCLVFFTASAWNSLRFEINVSRFSTCRFIRSTHPTHCYVKLLQPHLIFFRNLTQTDFSIPVFLVPICS